MADDAVVDQITEASKSDAPRMPTPFSAEVELLRGLYVKETDEWHTVAVVRELNGADEEYLAELGTRAGVTYTEYMTGVLSRAVTSIGTLPADSTTLDKLILPDRDLLFLAIVRATYGKEREVSATCPSCGNKQNIIIELDEDFPVLGQERDLRQPIAVELRSGMTSFRYPNGEITGYAVKKSKNTAELDTLVIAQCIITKDETPLDERIQWARDLGVADRKKVDAALAAAVQDVGPQLGEVDTRCTDCNEDLPLLMDWVSLLLG